MDNEPIKNKPKQTRRQINDYTVLFREKFSKKRHAYQKRTKKTANFCTISPLFLTKLARFCQFLSISVQFCLAHFNICAFARAKTPLTTQKQIFPPKISEIRG
jgi:hypothetical protein